MYRKFKRNENATTNDRDMMESIIDVGAGLVRLNFSDGKPEIVAVEVNR